MFHEADLAVDQMTVNNLCGSYGDTSVQCQQALYSQQLGFNVWNAEHPFGFDIWPFFWGFSRYYISGVHISTPCLSAIRAVVGITTSVSTTGTTGFA